MENVSTGKLELYNEAFVCDLSNMCNSSDKVKTSQENKSKSPKVTSVLDPFCKTSVLNESSDFMECNYKKKFKSERDKIEILCSICKENITNLDLRNREMHVNNCIDKQISSDSEIKMPVSETENPFILECPLCFKEFSSTELRSNHIKKCGKSKGLCLQSIIKALQLQERHALERISLGLPVKPIKPVKSNKNPIPKQVIIEPMSKAQSDIQLAKALSLSLTTSAQEDVKIGSLPLKPPNVHQRPGKRTKAVLSNTPLLVLRTEEERKRLLLNKVAAIVAPGNSDEDGSPPVESDILDVQQMGDAAELGLLWHLSSKASETDDYYIEELTSWIKPSDVEVGTKLCRLSQIPGHEIVTQLPCEYTFSTPLDADKTFSESVGPISSDSTIIECLRLLVASSWMSDVDIHTNCGTIIPAHRLLLAARCPPLKHDTNFCSGIEKKILKWEMVSFDAALQFLNFLYTGNMEVKKTMIPDLSYLANKYQVLDLQAFLHSTDSLSSPSEMELEQRIPLNANDVTISSTQPELGLLHKSQEEMNIDLDIVCDCINSSSPHPCVSQLCQLESASSSKYSQKSKHVEDCEISPEIESNAYKLLETAVHNCFSTKDSCPTSPVIFDVCDRESDSSSDDKNAKIVMNCPQKSSFRSKSDQQVEDVDLESDNSQDSVKFLKSSFTSFNRPSKEFEKVENFILSSPSSLKMSVFSSCINDFSIKSSISQKLNCSQTSNNTNMSNEEDVIPLNEINWKSRAIENSNESKLDSTQIINSARTDDDITQNNLLFEEISHTSSMAHKSDIISSPKSCKWVDYTSPTKNIVKPNILCDSDSASKLHISNLQKMSSSNKCETNIQPSSSGSVTGTHLIDCVLDFKGRKGFHENRKQYCTTEVGKPRAESCICKNSNSCTGMDVTCSCSSIHGSSTLTELLSLCSGERKLDKTVSYTSNLDAKMLNINDSIPSPLPFSDSCEYFEHDVWQENSEVVPLNLNSKSSREKTTNEKMTTPLCKLSDNHPQFRLSDSPVTPLPDYKTMLTPDIKQALRKIGVKALPRKKAIALLSHVYEEIHPLVDGETSVVSESQIEKSQKISGVKSMKRRFSNEEMSKPSKKQQKEIAYTQDASQESDDSSSENPDWLGCVPEMSFSQFREDSPTKANKDDIESITKFIQSNDDLYTRILSYKPLNMVEFHQELKNSGIKVSIQKLTDFLDEQCITFTCPRKEEFRKKQTARTQRFRKNMIAKLSQQPS